MSMVLPRYPIYVPSKGRSKPTHGLTIRRLLLDRVPFHLVVEPAEVDTYTMMYPGATILEAPENDMGVMRVRNWVKAHSIDEVGAERHWQIDDNVRRFYRLYRGKRLPCKSGIALAVMEDFCDRYTNVAIAGPNYEMFAPPGAQTVPFRLNVHVYSISLINNALPYAWRLRYNEDTDLCLQALSNGWCTVQFQAFLADKMPTMVLPGGNTEDLYQDDGRVIMSRTLERVWPGVVTTQRRFNRPQHVVANDWKKFDTPLKRRPDLDFDNLPAVNEYGMKLVARKAVRSDVIQALLDSSGPPSVLREHDSKALARYVTFCSQFFEFDAEEFAKIAAVSVLYYKGNDEARDGMRRMQELEKRWYDRLLSGTGEPDFSVYDDPYYPSDLWACWVVYSRPYLRNIIAQAPIMDALGKVGTVVDLGCGVGYTTAALAEIFPGSTVYGTQIETSGQYTAAESFGQDHRFSMIPSVRDLHEQPDLIFASEYFEHFHQPVAHLLEILDTVEPRVMIIANAFGSTSIGHFPSYKVNGKEVPNTKVGRIFNSTMRQQGFVMEKTKLWNNRPAIWIRS